MSSHREGSRTAARGGPNLGTAAVQQITAADACALSVRAQTHDGEYPQRNCNPRCGAL